MDAPKSGFDRLQEIQMGLFGKLKSAKKVMETVPQVKEPWHLVLFIVNIILPGKR